SPNPSLIADLGARPQWPRYGYKDFLTGAGGKGAYSEGQSGSTTGENGRTGWGSTFYKYVDTGAAWEMEGYEFASSVSGNFGAMGQGDGFYVSPGVLSAGNPGTGQLYSVSDAAGGTGGRGGAAGIASPPFDSKGHGQDGAPGVNGGNGPAGLSGNPAP